MNRQLALLALVALAVQPACNSTRGDLDRRGYGVVAVWQVWLYNADAGAEAPDIAREFRWWLLDRGFEPIRPDDPRLSRRHERSSGAVPETLGFQGTGDLRWVTVRADIFSDRHGGIAVTNKQTSEPKDPLQPAVDQFEEDARAWLRGWDAIVEYRESAAVYLPESLLEAEEVGALVVLHGNGSTKDQVLQSFWRDVADELGLALVAPTGPVLAGKTPQEGMAWFSDLEAFQNRYWDPDDAIQPALRQLREMKQVDPRRTVIAGEGQGGTIAFDAAMRTPSKYRWVVAVDANILVRPCNPPHNSPKVRLVANERSMFGVPPELIGQLLDHTVRVLERASIDVHAERYRPDPARPGLRKALVLKALRGITAESGE